MALLRCPFFLVFPVAVLFAVGTVLMGIAHGTHPGVIVAEAFGVIAVPCSYFEPRQLRRSISTAYRITTSQQ